MSRLLSWRVTVTKRLLGHHADRGAGFVEYAGLLLLIAAIVAAVFSTGIDSTIADAVQQAVRNVTNSG